MQPAPISIIRFTALVSLLIPLTGTDAQDAPPTSLEAAATRTPVFVGADRSTPPLANFRLHLELPRDASRRAQLRVGETQVADLGPTSAPTSFDLVIETAPGGMTQARSRTGDAAFGPPVPLPLATGGSTWVSDQKSAHELYRLDRPATVVATFQSKGDGTIFSRCSADGKWSRDAKAVFIRGGRIVFDIGWVGDIGGGPQVDDGRPHRVTLVSDGRNARLFLDGKRIANREGFGSKDADGHVFKIGAAAPDFAGDLSEGTVSNVRFWARALEGDELDAASGGDLSTTNTPDLNWNATGPEETFSGRGLPGLPVTVDLVAEGDRPVGTAWVQPLGHADHAKAVEALTPETLARGESIYRSLCITCHGDLETEGSLPTAPKFHTAAFKNGHDPFRMFQTLERGYGLMVPQPQYSAADKYAVIHFIRESFLKSHNEEQYFDIAPDYLDGLPLATSFAPEPVDSGDGVPPYEQMDFGNALFWTYQIDRGTPLADANIAFKGIAIRTDPGPGGVSRGNAWMVYDHDTMRVAAAATGDTFVDWKGIAFDGSHGTHTSLTGDLTFATRSGAGWARPSSGGWGDPRIEGRDGRRFGPLPKDWVEFLGLYRSGEQNVLSYTVGGIPILELPGMITYGSEEIFTRTIEFGPTEHPLVMALADESPALRTAVTGTPEATIGRDAGLLTLTIPPSPGGGRIKVLLGTLDQASLDALASGSAPADIAALTGGSAPRWPEQPKTMIDAGSREGAFTVDTLTVPHENPWHSWMRLTGIDFLPGGDTAAVCTWMGDVWLVDGIASAEGELVWQRIATGLFQPLGIKVVGDDIFVGCRDQIARLEDTNGDREVDVIHCFNNDHQVTEHFHEFAMGLQQDPEGNFYYAKSARHAKTALVPHHGTLLRVSPDGARTDIVATGFRAANGVCLNPDGTWIVTDQEGHWNPKNRINYVREGGFYGNIFGFTDVTDPADSAMEKPLCWITNSFDRSPSELLWVPENASWGSLNGQLLNLSYGYGKIYVVPHEEIDGQMQGGMCELPIPQFPTGIMRARFHPGDGQLYGVGMFAWGGNQKTSGGFYRVRRNAAPAQLPVGLAAEEGQLAITFSEPLPAGDQPASAKISTWDLKRSANYGSKHLNEKILKITGSSLSADRQTLLLEVPDVAPTRGMEIRVTLADGRGGKVERVVHSTIHQISD